MKKYLSFIDNCGTELYNKNGDDMESKTRYLLNNEFFDKPIKIGSTQIVQLGRRFCSPSEEIKAHAHLGWFELTVITSGRGSIGANGEFFSVNTGDVFISFPYDLHEIKASKNVKLEYDFCAFFCTDKELQKVLKNYAETPYGMSNRIVHSNKLAEIIKSALTEYSEEPKPYRDRALESIFNLLLITLVRALSNVKTTTTNVSEAEILCLKIMNYVDTHVYSLLNLQEVAVEFGYSYGYLCGFFKRTTGKKLSEYYLNRKMETAKALVIEGKKKIGEIAESLNYSLYSFSKAFKAKYGVSPKEMQLNQKE